MANGGTQIGQRDHARTVQGSNLTDIQFQFPDVLVQIHRIRVRLGWRRHIGCGRRIGISLNQHFLVRQIDQYERIVVSAAVD